MKPLIPVFGNLSATEHNRWIEVLSNRIPEAQFAALQDLSEAERNHVTVAVVANPKPEDIATLPALVWVQSLWAGVEKLIHFFSQSPIKVARLEDPALANTMAEAALTWTLYLHRNMHRYAHQQQQQIWRQFDYVPPQERTVTILGLGNLGKAIAASLKLNGFDIAGWSRTPKQLEGVQCYAGPAQLKTALNKGDIVISVLPHTTETDGLFDAETLSFMKPGSQLINFGRGSLIVEKDLLSALDSGHVEHAVLDVFSEEPLNDNHLFWPHRHVTVLPHISAQTRLDTASDVVAKNITTFFETNKLPETVNFKRGY